MFYELFGLPLGRLRRMAAVPLLSDARCLAAPSPEGRVGRRGSSGAISYRAGLAARSYLSLVVSPSTPAMWMEERSCHFLGDPTRFFVTTTRCCSVHLTTQ